MRYKLLYRLKLIFKIDQGMILPWYVLIIKFILFPADFIRWFYRNDKFFSYNFDSDTFTIFGVKYSAELFQSWSRDGFPIGTKFEIIYRAEDGVITVKKLEV